MMWNVPAEAVENKAKPKEFDFEIGDCRACGTPFAIEHVHHEMGLCNSCARIVASSWLLSAVGVKQ